MRLLFITLLCTLFTVTSQSQDHWGDIHNDCFWTDIDGKPIYSQGGGIFRFGNRYYWYGVHYRGAETYRADPSVTNEDTHFVSVTCYSSDNLTDWKYEADVLTPDELEGHERVMWLGRLGVAYAEEMRQYCMVVQFNNRVLFLTANTPTGQFRWHHLKDMEPIIGTSNTGDQTVFTDPDIGRSFLIYSYGRGRNRIYVSEIGARDGKIDLLDCHEVYHGESREGNCMFKRGGRYYMCASNIYGWDGSLAYYLVADSIFGPYLPKDDMQVMRGCEADYSHVSQTGFFYTLRAYDGNELVLFCGDRWSDFAGNGLGYNQWVPLSFDAEGTPEFHSLSSWQLSHERATWRVGADNDYVLNGSFEADRRIIPCAVKPRQEFLRGWRTTVVRGHAIAVDDSLSPQLNHLNSQADRRQVTGEKSLKISDSASFSRLVSQTLQALPPGRYTLRAKAKCSFGFQRLQMFAGRLTASGQSFEGLQVPIHASTDWQTIELDGIEWLPDTDSLTIGFFADSDCAATCLIDDVSFKACEQ